MESFAGQYQIVDTSFQIRAVLRLVLSVGVVKVNAAVPVPDDTEGFSDRLNAEFIVP